MRRKTEQPTDYAAPMTSEVSDADQPSGDARVARQVGEEPSSRAEPRRGIGRKPRTQGDTAATPSIQLALGLFVVFLFLLVLWLAWPFLSGGG